MSNNPRLLQPQQTLTASATGNPRNKVALKPGRSLLDWIKLTHKEPDIAGTGGKIRPVTQDELRRHNKPGDVWIVIRGQVYNVSAYMDFHPGGEEELMKGAGKDATKLFNDVHPWVNYNQMLKKCLVGPYKSGGTLPDSPFSPPVALPGSLQPVKHGTPKPTFSQDWSQNPTSVTITIRCRNKKLSSHSLVADILESGTIVRAVVRVSGWCYLLHVQLSQSVENELETRIPQDGSKIDLILLKASSGDWSSLGNNLGNHGTITEADEIKPTSRRVTLVYKEEVSHDTRLYCLKVDESSRVGIPIGQHVELRRKDEDLGRFYTPVDPALSADPLDLSPNLVYFLIKVYPSGKFTKQLDGLPEGDELEMSDPMGSFDSHWLDQWDELLLLAAGTGITPMIRVLNYVFNKNKQTDVRLLMFNKTEKDITWKEPLKTLTTQVNKFHVTHVLSEPVDGWGGPTGRVRSSLIKSHSTTDNKDLGVLVCGSTGFNGAALSAAKDSDISEKQIFIFSG